MKLRNDTNWDTNQFKGFIRVVAESEALTPDDISKLDVKLKYGRRSNRRENAHVRAWGYYGRWDFRLAVVKDVKLDKVYLARTIAIMLTYNQGVRAGKVRHNPSFYGKGWQEKWAWASELPLEMHIEQPVVKPTKPIKVLQEIQHCLTQVVAWETKRKLADTKIKTWQRKLRYYEKRSRELDGGIHTAPANIVAPEATPAVPEGNPGEAVK